MSHDQRKLAAIMFTDMVGYTALGQRNESLSLALVKEQRKLIRPILTRHHGREVKTIGDALLVVFPDALDAARCAYDIQRVMREYNIPLSEEKRLHLRVGIHLGDVVESEGDISGDAVNVASRIESLAEDGGVCLTRQVSDQVVNKLDVRLESLGQKQLKNIASPVEVYRMVMPWEEKHPAPTAELDTRRVAVLPFANMSPDPGDSYFADGITEEIISTLSNVGSLRVISRTSAMGYKGTTKKIGEIGNELHVGSVLEGSFRKSGNRIRVTTQLIDANDDSHVWAQSYEKELGDVFAVQTDIAKQVVDALKVTIRPAEARRIERAPTNSPEAFALYLKGRHYWNERSEPALRRAIQSFERAVEIDSSFALAYTGIADSYLVMVHNGMVKPSEGQPVVRRNLERALALNEELGEVHATFGNLLFVEWEWTRSESELKRALELSLSYATAHHWYSLLLIYMGRLEQALVEIGRARELDPTSLQIMTAQGITFGYMRDYKAELDAQKRVLEIDPDFGPAMWNIFSAYLHQSMTGEAASMIPRYEKIWGKEPEGWLAYAYAAVGKKEEARKILVEAEKISEDDVKATTFSSIALAHLWMGEKELALDWLEKGIRYKDRGLSELKVNPEYDSLRGEPRFQNLMKRIGLQ